MDKPSLDNTKSKLRIVIVVLVNFCCIQNIPQLFNYHENKQLNLNTKMSSKYKHKNSRVNKNLKQ